jgi:transposase
MAAVEITRRDLDVAELRKVASRTSDAKQARRILAIAMVLDGHSRLDAAQASGMDRQTLRDWVHRYNAFGVAGLSDARRPGRPAALDQGMMEELRQLVLVGPDPVLDGVVRWRCVDLRSAIQRRYGVVLHKRTVGKLLGRLRMTRLQPRPYHPKKDAEAQQAFKKTSPPGSPTPCRRRPPARVSKSGSRTKPGSANRAH